MRVARGEATTLGNVISRHLDIQATLLGRGIRLGCRFLWRRFLDGCFYSLGGGGLLGGSFGLLRRLDLRRLDTFGAAAFAAAAKAFRASTLGASTLGVTALLADAAAAFGVEGALETTALVFTGAVFTALAGLLADLLDVAMKLSSS